MGCDLRSSPPGDCLLYMVAARRLKYPTRLLSHHRHNREKEQNDTVPLTREGVRQKMFPLNQCSQPVSWLRSGRIRLFIRSPETERERRSGEEAVRRFPADEVLPGMRACPRLYHRPG